MARPDQLLYIIGKEIEENMSSYEIELNNKIYGFLNLFLASLW